LAVAIGLGLLAGCGKKDNPISSREEGLNQGDCAFG